MFARHWKWIAAAPLLAVTCFAQSIGPRRYEAPEKDRVRQAAARQLPSLNTRLDAPVTQSLGPVTPEQWQAAPEFRGLSATGLHRPLRLSGRWQTTSTGKRVWSAAVFSPGAAALRVHFSRFQAGEGRVWVHSGQPESGEIGGPYSGAGWTGDGDFWSDLVTGETIVIEYEPAAGAPADIPFTISEISHLAAEATPDGPRAAALSCHQDASCFPEWADTGRAIARILFESEGATYSCTGTLLNSRQSSNIPYFLTADHCIPNETVARTVQAFWFYQSERCNGPAPSTRDLPRSLGATYLTGGVLDQGDFTLLRLNSVPNGVVFSGWTADQVALDSPLVGVHHPAGDYRRLSQGRRAADNTLPRGIVRDRFYSVQWVAGRTEGGSSGSGVFSEPSRLVGTLYGGYRPAAGQTKCDVDPDYSFYGRFATAYPTLREFLEDRATTTPPPSPGTGTPTTLQPGQPVNFQVGPVSNPTLLNSPAALYRVTVPEGATRLQIRLTTQTAGADIDLYARFEQAPEVSGGRVLADHSSVTDGGDELITITPQSSPALRPGTYVVALALFTRNTTIDGSLAVTIETAAPDPAQPVSLTNGQPQSFRFSAVSRPTLMNNPGAMFQIAVPANASRLTVRLATTTPNADVDLYVRFNQAPVIEGSNVAADHRSEGATGDEQIIVTTTSSPALRTGTYTIALAVFTPGVAVEGTLTATIETNGVTPPPASQSLFNGQPQAFSIGPVSQPTLLNTPTSLYQVVVPEGVSRLTLRLTTETPNVDVDLYARFGTAPSVESGRVLADFGSVSDTGNEEIVISSTTTPALQPGTYYIALALFTTGITARGQLVATFETAGSPVRLTSGQPRPFSFAAVNTPTLMNAPSSLFEVTVPEGARSLQVKLTTTTPNADVDLFLRLNGAPSIVNGRVQADHASSTETGNESITVTAASSPPLQPGAYTIALAVFTQGIAVEGTIEAIVVAEPSQAPSEPRTLTSGEPAQFTLSSVSEPTLFTGVYSYRIQVPEGATRLQVRAVSADPTVDIDLFLRRGADVELRDREVVADFSSQTETGNESITVTTGSNPALQPGTYYASLALFTTGVPASGTIVATVERSGAPTLVGRLIQPGQTIEWTVPAVEVPTLFNRDDSLLRIEVPAEASALRLELQATPGSVDLDLFARYDAPPATQNGAVVADHRAIGPTGNEQLTITRSSLPALRPGVYYIALASFTTNAPATARLTATFSSGEASAISSQPESLRKSKPLVREFRAPEKPVPVPE